MTAAPTTQEDGLARRPLMRYRTIDLLVPVALGVAFGVAFRGYGLFYQLMDPITALYKPAEGLLTGIWFLPALLAGFIVRRPGAALLAEVIAASLEALLGGQWGPGTVISGVLQGGGIELALLLFRYRRFTLPVAILGGVFSAVLEWIYESNVYFPEFSTTQTIMLLIFFVISGIVLCALLGWALIRALAATGALDALPAGRARHREHLV